MQIFRFKKFNVVNERSAMKVNTDGVLLGAAMTLKPEDSRLLDIGTGTGTIALMAAQRLREKQLISEASANISQLSKECAELGKEIGMSIYIQHEDIFNAMHSI